MDDDLLDEDTVTFEGQEISYAEFKAICRALCIDLVRAGHPEVRIEHGEHLTLQ